ncbi:MAG: hypothetical protein FWF53_07085 [Candidatus Azobacteroides sp.]|nr:hypothetical protein [Candidatus Azobacteroides sp.]
MKSERCMLLNPIKLNIGERVQSFYSKIPCELIEIKRGVAKMKNLTTGKTEYLNADNNRHFVRDKQLKLF